MPLSTPQLQALSDAVAALGLARVNTASVIGAIPVDAPAPPAPPPATVWADVAAEGAAFDLDAPARVRYGAGSSWSELDLPTGSNYCGNATFGGDPAPGVAKVCQVLTGAPAPVPAPPAPTPPAPTPPAPTPPAPAPGPAPIGTVLHFSMSGSNSNPGTEASPKRDLSGIDFSTLPAGSALRFQRGGSWSVSRWRLASALANRAAPITFEAYGTGPRPFIQFTDTVAGVEFGPNFSDMTPHEGYAFRGLQLRGPGQAFGFWFKGRVSDVTVEDCEMNNWNQSFDGQGGHFATRINILNNLIRGNHDTGVLGCFYDLLLEGNDFSDPNQLANHFVHRIYLSSGDRNVIRNNRAVSANRAMGGTCTVHGHVATSLTIEGNVFEYGTGPNGEFSDGGAYIISVNPYSGVQEVQGFNGLVIRGNTVQNGGYDAINVMSAPGALIEGNTIRLTHARPFQTAVAYTDDSEVPRNLRGPGIVRGNRAIGPAATNMTFVGPAGSTMSDNTKVTG